LILAFVVFNPGDLYYLGYKKINKIIIIIVIIIIISFLFQRLSVLIQRYNAILLHDCFVKEEEE